MFVRVLFLALLMSVSVAHASPCWFDKATREIGTREQRSNPKILQYSRDAGFNWRSDSTPWCAAFVASMLKRCGVRHTGSGLARSYSRSSKFTEIQRPIKGAIVVFSRGGRNSGKGHVGFYAGESGSSIKVLGGNQRDSVRYSNYGKDKLIGYYWPRGQPRTSSGGDVVDESPASSNMERRQGSPGSSDVNGNCSRRGYRQHQCMTSTGCSVAGGRRVARKGCPGASSRWMCCVTSGGSTNMRRRSTSRRGNWQDWD